MHIKMKETTQDMQMREQGVVILNLHIGPLRIRSGLASVPRCEPSTYQPISR